MFLILLCVCGLYFLYAKPASLNDIAGKAIPPCNEILQSSISLYNFKMMGTELLNFSYLYSLEDAIKRGYKVTLTLKNNSANCDYKSKTITLNSTRTHNDSAYVMFNTIYNLKVPGSMSWEATLKIVSTCIYDFYLAEYVNFTWTKTYKDLNTTSDFYMGYSKASCPKIQSSITITAKANLLDQMIRVNMLQY
jgi:hypothetical protein